MKAYAKTPKKADGNANERSEADMLRNHGDVDDKDLPLQGSDLCCSRDVFHCN